MQRLHHVSGFDLPNVKAKTREARHMHAYVGLCQNHESGFDSGFARNKVLPKANLCPRVVALPRCFASRIMTSKGVRLKTMFATWHTSAVLAQNMWEKNSDEADTRFYSRHHVTSTLNIYKDQKKKNTNHFINFFFLLCNMERFSKYVFEYHRFWNKVKDYTRSQISLTRFRKCFLENVVDTHFQEFLKYNFSW
jgi:hypothetical protein